MIFQIDNMSLQMRGQISQILLCADAYYVEDKCLLLQDKVHSHYAFIFLQFASNAKNGFHTHSLHLTQYPIDTMLEFDPNTNTHANLDASVNGPLKHG